ncbi:unnamed protein product, partial [Didymodactylos carnosus]
MRLKLKRDGAPRQ